MKHLFGITMLSSVIVLAGCSSAVTSDLQDFVEKSGKQFVGKVDPLPPIKKFVAVPYSGANMNDPFAKQPTPDEIVGSNAPDPNRKKEFLEGFGLEQLKLVGYVEKKGKPHGLVKSPDGTTNIVMIGHHLGLNYGKIVEIRPDSLQLVETVQDGKGIWIERPMEVLLVEK